jgi:hypothetical protein
MKVLTFLNLTIPNNSLQHLIAEINNFIIQLSLKNSFRIIFLFLVAVSR